MDNTEKNTLASTNVYGKEKKIRDYFDICLICNT